MHGTVSSWVAFPVLSHRSAGDSWIRGRADRNGQCCPTVLNAVGDCCTGSNARLDKDGMCCNSGNIDACGVCNGAGIAVDALGRCCEGTWALVCVWEPPCVTHGVKCWRWERRRPAGSYIERAAADRTGISACAAGNLDASGLCCPADVPVDVCGVCGGSGRCAVQLIVSLVVGANVQLTVGGTFLLPPKASCYCSDCTMLFLNP